MPLYTPAIFSGRRMGAMRGPYPSLGDVAPYGQPVTQFTYVDASTPQGFSPGNDGSPTRDWQAISDSEQQWRDEPNDVNPGNASNLTIQGPDDAPPTITKEYTHMDLNPHPQVQVPSVAVRNGNFNPSEAGVDNRRGVWRMTDGITPIQANGGQIPIGSQPFLGAFPSIPGVSANTLEIGSVIAGVLILVAGIAMYKNRKLA